MPAAPPEGSPVTPLDPPPKPKIESGAMAEGFGERGLLAPWGALRTPKNRISHPITSAAARENEFLTLFEHYCKLRPIRSHASPSPAPVKTQSSPTVGPTPAPTGRNLCGSFLLLYVLVAQMP